MCTLATCLLSTAMIGGTVRAVPLGPGEGVLCMPREGMGGSGSGRTGWFGVQQTVDRAPRAADARSGGRWLRHAMLRAGCP